MNNRINYSLKRIHEKIIHVMSTQEDKFDILLQVCRKSLTIVMANGSKLMTYKIPK